MVSSESHHSSIACLLVSSPFHKKRKESLRRAIPKAVPAHCPAVGSKGPADEPGSDLKQSLFKDSRGEVKPNSSDSF